MLYEFKCSDCEEVYEEMCSSYDETGVYEFVNCPKCGSSKKVKLITGCAYKFANPVGTDKWNNSHDYRFKHNLPNVLKEREEAERKSHMGAHPYNEIDDVSSGKYFGDVK